MNNKKLFVINLIIWGFLSAKAQVVSVHSPNNKIYVEMKVEKGVPTLETEYRDGKQYVSVSKVQTGIAFDKDATQMELLSVSPTKKHKDDYMMLSGKRSHCVNQANIRTFRFKDTNGKEIEIELRAYNDGIAFRYLTPKSDTIQREMTSFHVSNGINRWAQPLDLNGYEDFYYQTNNGKEVPNPKKETGKWGFPLLLEPAKGFYALLTEANILHGNCGAHLENINNEEQYDVIPASNTVIGDKLSTPWRIMIIGSLADIVQSTLVTDVSNSNRIDDTRWIQPGALSWVYWAYNHGSKDFQIVKQYVDLAYEMQWPYVLIDWEWDVMNNGGNIEDAIAYAKSKGIKVVLWYNSFESWGGDTSFAKTHDLRTPEGREKEMAWLEQMGVSGVKIDFFYGDSEKTMNYYLDLLECAARHHLMVNFHGATVPRGWQRTYPNLMSTEGVYGAEYYNNGPTLTDKAAWHNTVLPYTRNVIGPMDYTPGTFSNSQHPHITTFAHELALPFVFESAWQHMPDRPSAYLNLPTEVKSLLSSIPTVWDDTRLISGYPGQSIVIARRKGKTWYVAGLNGKSEPTTIDVDLSRLGKTIRIISDGADGQSFQIINTKTLSKNTTIKCRKQGGFVAIVQ